MKTVLRPPRPGNSFAPQKLAEVRTEFHSGRGFASARSTRFEQDAVGNFAGTAEALLVGETVVASESADGLTFALDKGQGRVRRHGVAKFLEFAVDSPFPERRSKGLRVEEDVNVFRKPLDQVPSLGEARAAFEDDDVVAVGGVDDVGVGGGRAGGRGDGAQRFRGVIVFSMIAGRSPSSRKCSAAWRIACSKSRCSNSLMRTALLNLPVVRAR